jgi:hypothetical protein
MSPEEARLLLSFHCGSNEQTDDPRWTNGFLGMLRPYKGLREESFHGVMDCIVALAEQLSNDPIERSLVSSLWGICHLGRSWGTEPGGMLGRNNLIATSDIERLSTWIDCISYATMILLDTGDLNEALDPYRQLGGKRESVS